MGMGIKMYNKLVCQNPQQMAEKLRNYYFLLDNLTLNANFKKITFESSSLDVNVKMRILIILKI